MMAVLLFAAVAWGYTPQRLQKSAAETNLQAAIDQAATQEEKTKLATDFLNSNPTDIRAARVAQDVLFKTLEDPAAFFKPRAETSESIADHYLYARAVGDSLIAAQEAAWILKQDPKNYWGHLMAGNAEWEKSKPDNAAIEQHFNEAITTDPSQPEAFVMLGYLYQDQDNWTKAREVFEAGRITDPENFLFKNALISVYATLRDGDAYFKLLDTMAPQEPVTGLLQRASNGTEPVDAAKVFRGTTTLVEYWAYT
jgi:tetratricopeptide (TPR) repeat protein